MSKTTHKRCPKCGERTLRKGARTAAGKVRWTCRGTTGDRRYCYQTTNPDAPYRGRNAPKEPEQRLEFPQKHQGIRRFVITSAQNATPLHTGFFKAIQAYVEHNADTAFWAIPFRYKNPTSRWEKSQVNEQWWAPELVPHLVNQRKQLNRNLIVMGDIKTQPTAVSPLSGFEAITHGESGIFGHPKLQMKTIPTPQNKMPKILTTTGAITVQNYSDTKTGKKGEFHHVLGAVIVELDKKGVFHLRHINARSDGAFIDLDKAYYPDGRVEDAGPYEAIVFGDTHVRFVDPVVDLATFKALVPRLNPKRLVYHDLLDAYAVNPHHEGKPFIAIAKRWKGFDDVKREVLDAIRWVETRTGKREGFIIASNHDNMLARWIDREDWKRDPLNAEFYLETALHMAKTVRIEKEGASIMDPFQYWASRMFIGKNVRCVERKESLTIAGIECGLHGDQGPNGARGSRRNLARIGVKTIIGHAHSPGIEEGCYQTGTMTPLTLEYTGAVGSWLNTHVGIDAFGKRHLFNCINGRFWINR